MELRLKLLADVGLVGLPNAGKSSLLTRVTRAAPKVAAYPFTTLSPVLGTLDLGDRQLVLADIPGLIEGAAEGAGLGHEFLAHAERCRLLVHLVELSPPEGDPVEAYETVREELAAHGAGLERLPEAVALTKSDLLPADAVEEAVRGWRERLASSVEGVVAISSATGAGLEELRALIAAALPEPPRPAEEPPDEFEAEHRVYRPAEEGYEVVAEGAGRFRVAGRGIELLAARHDLANEEALDHLEQRLREIGVIAELRRAGFEPGDEVLIADRAFELHPS